MKFACCLLALVPVITGASPMLAAASPAAEAKSGITLPEAFLPTEEVEAGGLARTFRDCAPIVVDGNPGRATILYLWRVQASETEEPAEWRLASMEVEILPADAAARCGDD